MINIRVIAKTIIVRYNDYRVSRKAGTQITAGPADVHYSLVEFSNAAAYYDWGADCKPTDTVTNMGDSVLLFEVLVDCIEPVRVIWL